MKAQYTKIISHVFHVKKNCASNRFRPTKVYEVYSSFRVDNVIKVDLFMKLFICGNRVELAVSFI